MTQEERDGAERRVSDARFRTYFEFGLVGDTMHQTDERVPVEDIRRLSDIYLDIMRRFFGV